MVTLINNSDTHRLRGAVINEPLQTLNKVRLYQLGDFHRGTRRGM